MGSQVVPETYSDFSSLTDKRRLSLWSTGAVRLGAIAVDLKTATRPPSRSAV